MSSSHSPSASYFNRLADIEVQLCMHGLDMKSLILFSVTSKRMMEQSRKSFVVQQLSNGAAHELDLELMNIAVAEDLDDRNTVFDVLSQRYPPFRRAYEPIRLVNVHDYHEMDPLMFIQLATLFPCVKEVCFVISPQWISTLCNQLFVVLETCQKMSKLELHFVLEVSFPELQLPRNLFQLELVGSFNLVGVKLPNSLKVLNVGGYNEQQWSQITLAKGIQEMTYFCDHSPHLKHIQWPEALSKLHFDADISLVDIQLPSNLLELQLGASYNRSLVGVAFPSSLTTLGTGYEYDHSFVHVQFPPNLRTLSITSSRFNHDINEVELPASLTAISFGFSFNSPINEGVLPAGLLSLEFSSHWNQPMHFVSALTSLVELHLHSFMSKDNIVNVQFPSSLRLIETPSDCDVFEQLKLPSGCRHIQEV